MCQIPVWVWLQVGPTKEIANFTTTCFKMAINLSVEGVASNLSLEGMTKLLQQRHQEGEPGQEEHVVLS
jgi:hypothetical protein